MPKPSMAEINLILSRTLQLSEERQSYVLGHRSGENVSVMVTKTSKVIHARADSQRSGCRYRRFYTRGVFGLNHINVNCAVGPKTSGYISKYMKEIMLGDQLDNYD